MKRRVIGLVLALLVAAATVGIASAELGDYESQNDFELETHDGSPSGLVWDGNHIRLLRGRTLRAYTTAGDYIPDQNFTVRPPYGSFYSSVNFSTKGSAWNGTHYFVLGNNSFMFGCAISGGTTGNSSPPHCVYGFESDGSIVSGFSADSSNVDSDGMVWNGSGFRIVDYDDDKVYAHTANGNRDATSDFDLNSANTRAQGITWNGTHYYVVDDDANKVFAYDAAGNYTAGLDWDLATNNADPTDITWDGSHFWVPDDDDDEMYAYTGSVVEVDYTSIMTATTVARGDWKCISSRTGVTAQINNAALTFHGFCVKTVASAGMEVEVHLASATRPSEMAQFVRLSGGLRFIEGGSATSSQTWVYDDSLTTESSDVVREGSWAFTESLEGFETSNRLGYATSAKSVTDNDCAEERDDSSESTLTGRGFNCQISRLTDLSVGDNATLQYTVTPANDIDFADTPNSPDSLVITRNTEYTTATVNWTLYDAVVEYEVQRTTAVQVDVADASRIEYGDPVTYMILSTQAGIDEYEDTSLQAHRTYQYRVRARGADSASWSAWSDYVFSGAKPEVDLPAPGNLELHRNSSSVTASWGAPVGDFDNFTLQRQELILVGGSTFFGNVRSLGDDMWLPMASTMFEDTSILPGQTYEYRVAAVLDDQVGVYTDWFRVGPVNASLGPPPTNFRPLQTPVVTRGFVERVFGRTLRVLAGLGFGRTRLRLPGAVRVL